jgi:hypothetical protein
MNGKQWEEGLYLIKTEQQCFFYGLGFTHRAQQIFPKVRSKEQLARSSCPILLQLRK